MDREVGQDPTATERVSPVYRLPGLSLRAATVVVDLAVAQFLDWDRPTGRPKVLSVVAALRLTLCRLRRNATYQDLSEDFGVGRSTAWNYHQEMVGFLADALGCADDELPTLVAGRVCLVDGTLIPTVAWRHRRDLKSGKHRRHGVNVQLLVDLHGRLLAASQAFPGSWHDVHCFRAAGWVRLVRQAGGALGDLGYQGESDVIHVPIRKRPTVDLHGVERDINHSFARVRVAVEWGAAHLKNWRIATTRYRSNLTRIDVDIQAIVGLQKLNEQYAQRTLTYTRIKAA